VLTGCVKAVYQHNNGEFWFGNLYKMRFSVLQIFLFELAIWLVLWLVNDYIATLLTFILGSIFCAILIFALIAEGIERSKVPRKYFEVMAMSIIAPLLAGAVYLWLFGGSLTFLSAD
jgi:hypothetical protein